MSEASNAQGRFVAAAWLISPPILAILKWLKIEPIAYWPWFYVTLPWWMLFLWVVFATMVAKAVVKEIKKEFKIEDK